MWSPRLQLARDGRCVAFITDAGVTIQARGELALPDVRCLAAFDDQLWTVADNRLQRWGFDGRAIGPVADAPAVGTLVPALVGPPMAAWSNASRAWIDPGDGELHELPLLDSVMILPFAGRRWFVIERDRVRLGSATFELAGAKLIAAAALGAGDTALLAVDRDGERQAWVSDLDGTRLATHRLPDGELRLAASAGVVVARDGATLFALDLATGTTHALVDRADVIDFAIDADAATLAVRDARGVHVVALRERRVVPPAPPPEPAPPPAPPPVRATSASWIAAELDRIWLLGERQLRRLQLAGVRPGPGTAQMIGIETLLKLRRRDDDLDRAIATAVARVDRAREHASISALAERTEMTELELEVLAFAVAAAIDPNLGELFAALRGVPNRRTLDIALVGELLELTGDDVAALVAACMPGRTLLAWRLVQLDSAYDVHASPLQRGCHVAPEVASALAGDPGWLARDGECRIEHADATFEDLTLDAGVRARIASLAANAPEWLVVYGPRGVGKRTIAARLAACWGRPIAIVEPRGVKLEERLKLAQRDALIADAVLCVGPIAAGVDASDLVAALASFPDRVVLAFETREAPRVRTPRSCDELELPLPSEQVRADLWRQQLGETAHSRALARNFRLTPGEIARAAEEAFAGGDAQRERRVRDAIERCLRNELGEIARRLPTAVNFDDVVLAPDKLQRVRELVSRRLYAHRVYGEWGVAGNADYGRGLIALLSGPSGTGKTLLARVIAHELDLDLYQVDLASVFSRWVGETEKALARVFDQAERAHAVLLFDEADALFAKRTSMDDSRDRYANVTVNFLLQRIEQYDGVAVMTTNKQAALDEAMARRLTLHLHLDEPELAERELLWRKHLPSRAPGAASVDVAQLAREFVLTGGYIKNIAVRAAFLAAARSCALSTALVRDAAFLELEDLGRVVTRNAA